jgi:hypothetical protein
MIERQGALSFFCAKQNIIPKTSLSFDPIFWKILMQIAMLKTVISKKESSFGDTFRADNQGCGVSD